MVNVYLNKEEIKTACNLLDCTESDLSKVVKATITDKKESEYFRSFDKGFDIQDIASVYSVIYDIQDPNFLVKLLAIGVSKKRRKALEKILNEVDIDEDLKKPTKL